MEEEAARMRDGMGPLGEVEGIISSGSRSVRALGDYKTDD